jgi:hypothetical protein
VRRSFFRAEAQVPNATSSVAVAAADSPPRSPVDFICSRRHDIRFVDLTMASAPSG